MHDILITNIKGLVQVRDQSPRMLKGKQMSELPILSNAFLVIAHGLIHSYGLMEQLPHSPDVMGPSGYQRL